MNGSLAMRSPTYSRRLSPKCRQGGRSAKAGALRLDRAALSLLLVVGRHIEAAFCTRMIHASHPPKSGQTNSMGVGFQENLKPMVPKRSR
jgi:hypothetical protein